MSYAEHGPRIFLAGNTSNGSSSPYGDHSLINSRLDGRLKTDESCSDIRAWSSDPFELSRYFRELTEYASEPKITISNSKQNNANYKFQAQGAPKKKQENFVKISSEKMQQLNNFVNEVNCDEAKGERITNRSVMEFASRIFDFSRFLSQYNIYLPFQFHSKNNDKHIEFQIDVSDSTCSLEENPRKSRSCILRCIEAESDDKIGDHLRRPIICVDKFLQTVCSTNEIGIQTHIYEKRIRLSSQSLDNYSDEGSDCTSDENISQAYSSEKESSDFESPSNAVRKELLIEKESKIIALQNEIAAKDAELDELQDVNTKLETFIKEKEKNLMVLQKNIDLFQANFTQMNDQHTSTICDLEKKLYTYTHMVSELNTELNQKYQMVDSQCQEIEKLKIIAKEAKALRSENEELTTKLKNMSKEAESCGLALKQMKEVVLERDSLLLETRKQSCLLADQEDEMKRLRTKMNQIACIYNNQKIVKMVEMLFALQEEVQEKDKRIVLYEKRVRNMDSTLNELAEKLEKNEKEMELFQTEKYLFKGQDTISCNSVYNCQSLSVDCIDETEYKSELTIADEDVKDANLQESISTRRMQSYTKALRSQTKSKRPFAIKQVNNFIEAKSDTDQSTDSYEGDVNQLLMDASESVRGIIFDEIKQMLQQDEEFCHDEDIDKALTIHMKKSIAQISKISTALKGAGDNNLNIKGELIKCKSDIRDKDIVIAELNKQISLYNEQRVSEDVASEINAKDKRVSELMTDLEQKEHLIHDLKEKNKSLKEELLQFHKKYDEVIENIEKLKLMNKQLEKSKWQLEKLIKDVDEELKEKEASLVSLQIAKTQLEYKLSEYSETICEKDKNIKEMELNYESIIEDIKNENILLDENRQKAAAEIELLKETIVTLKEENDRTILNTLKEQISKLEDQDRQRSLEMNKHKSELMQYQNFNRKLEDKLQSYSKMNEQLAKDIKYLKSGNEELSAHFKFEIASRDTLKEKLTLLPQQIISRISALKMNCALDKSQLYNNLLPEKEYETTENQSMKELLHENEKKEDKIQTLINDIEDKNLEIKNLKESMNNLSQKTGDLQEELNNEKAHYQKRLDSLQQSYQRNVHTLRNEHNNSIQRLQKYCDEIEKQTIYNSKTWIRSLSGRELLEIQNQIRMLLANSATTAESKLKSSIEDKTKITAQRQTKSHLGKNGDALLKGDTGRKKSETHHRDELEKPEHEINLSINKKLNYSPRSCYTLESGIASNFSP
ncbi:putative leucine-rich repeat-containing protein DDB_G0290503 [Prorops nasuta]|uniref:putative leucine-rich repeat-containing protein DDB_G0290503 n=1 Tax=Prorops nasuta TaxID=863751 RepID=UPI0034CF0370